MSKVICIKRNTNKDRCGTIQYRKFGQLASLKIPAYNLLAPLEAALSQLLLLSRFVPERIGDTG